MCDAPPRIAVLVEHLKSGGVQQVLLQLLPALTRGKYDLRLWTMRGGAKNLEMLAAFREAGLSPENVSVRGADDGPRLRALARRLRDERIALLNTHSLLPNLAGGAAAVAANTPALAAVFHGDYAYRWKPKTVAVQKSLRDRTDAFVCVSEAVRKNLQPRLALPESKIHVVPNGLDLSRLNVQESQGQARRALGLPEGRPIVASIGRLNANKNVAGFLEAVAILRETMPDLLALVAGEGELREDLEDHAGRLGLDDACRFLGARRDVPRLLRAIDALALTSRSEGMPLVVLEAFASGTPVVSTPAGGVPELLRDGKNGLLVPVDAPRPLAEALGRILRDPVFARLIAAQARSDVQHRSLSAWAARTESVFDAVLAARQDAIRNRLSRPPSDAAIAARLAALRFRFRFRRIASKLLP